MPLYIKDETTTKLVNELARRRGLTKQKAVRLTVEAELFEIAVEAYAQFGKGRHPAALNMGDCFAYACTRTNDARLLFKGEEFARTDIEPAQW